ncbi:unnamed protein product [Caenorhabditis angaria]|uniref:Uncharacterized protein n=1 Tax=Caenorhabditis angaria TaxID=860376 RepID=A0A9P1IWZ4_9PELO|nr:unnamed protein product [Caenorhabditis angaria]
MRFFDDPRRAAIRERKNISFLTDFLVRSESSDYHYLRIVFNALIGFAVATILYYVAWNSLNFGSFNETYSRVIQAIIIGSSTYAFATSSIFRCALFCVLIGAFGKQGQYPFTMLVASNLHDGPITNMMNNYQTTADIVICHIDLQGKIVANRVALMTGPLQKIIEQLTTKGTRAMRNLARGTRTLLGPFMDLIHEDDEGATEDEKIEELTKEQVVKIEKRREQIVKMYEKSLGRELNENNQLFKDNSPPEHLYYNETFDDQPAWMRFKMGNRAKICEEIATEMRGDV